MLSGVEQSRLKLSKSTDAKKKSCLGQFLTPAQIAAFMADLFPPANGICRLLDAGAGIGSLAAAFLERWVSGGFGFQRVEVDAFEVDDSLHRQLAKTLGDYKNDALSIAIHGEDFIHAASDAVFNGWFSKTLPRYTHAILNPPYRKIGSNSAHRLALRRAGIETVNMYSAFVALAVAQAAPGGQIVAIIPRSFCNGPYYRPFREFVLERASIHHIHLFGSRSKAFKDDDVLQENIIIRLERNGQQGPVTITTSTDGSFSDLTTCEHPFERIVLPCDHERFVHVPATSEQSIIEQSKAIHYTLTDLGIKVSTGPVVDFRLKKYLRDMPRPGTVPLLYPGHFTGGTTKWPIEETRKPNAIELNTETEKWLYPNGFYCVVRRFSAKEEKRRVMASVVEPALFGSLPLLGFENHLNLFHENRRGLPEALARGMAAFLNTTAVDEHFRCFNGHTQVNATDLRLMKYPSRQILIQLGEWIMRQGVPSQGQVEAKVGALTA